MLVTDQDYLRSDQYHDATKLDARAELHRRYSENKQGWMSWIFEQLNLPASATILEMGCGPGWLWAENISRLPEAWRVILSDFSPGMLQAAIHTLDEHATRFRFVAADAQQIPFPDNTFDAVIANFMLYHVPDRDKSFADVRRVLKPGGVFYAGTNGENHLAELHDLAQESGLATVFGPERVFSLENGGAQLERWFTDVRLIRYPDGLVVTDAEPLIAFARSVAAPGPGGQEAALAEFSRRVRAEIAAIGSIRIRKNTGLFICRSQK